MLQLFFLSFSFFVFSTSNLRQFKTNREFISSGDTRATSTNFKSLFSRHPVHARDHPPHTPPPRPWTILFRHGGRKWRSESRRYSIRRNCEGGHEGNRFVLARREKRFRCSIHRAYAYVCVCVCVCVQTFGRIV